MTIDEAIIHAEEVEKIKNAEAEEQVCARNGDHFCVDDIDKYYECKECAAEHSQLVEWLRSYKEIIELVAEYRKPDVYMQWGSFQSVDAWKKVVNIVEGNG